MLTHLEKLKMQWTAKAVYPNHWLANYRFIHIKTQWAVAFDKKRAHISGPYDLEDGFYCPQTFKLVEKKGSSLFEYPSGDFHKLLPSQPLTHIEQLIKVDWLLILDSMSDQEPCVFYTNGHVLQGSHTLGRFYIYGQKNNETVCC